MPDREIVRARDQNTEQSSKDPSVCFLLLFVFVICIYVIYAFISLPGVYNDKIFYLFDFAALLLLLFKF